MKLLRSYLGIREFQDLISSLMPLGIYVKLTEYQIDRMIKDAEW